jgi:tellurite resistance protein TerC
MYDVSLLVWVLTAVWFLGLLAGELFLNRKLDKPLTTGTAVRHSIVWIAIGLGFGLFILYYLGPKASGEYYTGYLIEESLSIDNIFVWSMLFAYLKIPRRLQHTVLYWGIIGAIFFRTIFMIIGIIVISKFQFVLILMGILLLYTSYKIFKDKNSKFNPEKSKIYKFVQKVLPFTDEIHGKKLIIKKNGKRVATYLLFAICIIELTDIMFAIDSVPTVLAVVRDPYIAITSNIAALLGLRALYFVFDGLKNSFWLLNKGLGLILGIIGVTLLLEPESVLGIHWFGLKMQVYIILPIVFTIIALSILGSYAIKNPKKS